ALLVVFLTALVCSSLVSAAVVVLRPIQLENQLLERSRHIVQLSGLVADGETGDDEMLAAYRALDRRILDIDAGRFEGDYDADTFDMRRAANDPELSVAVPANLDRAALGRRSRFAPVYIVWGEDALERVVLPVSGNGMWSMLYGFIALESDLNTIAGMTFYEQNETPGLGDRITQPEWLAQWQGRQILDSRGEQRFRVGEGRIDPDSDLARHEVDALTGATVTADAVTGLITYWFGDHGFAGLLEEWRENPPQPPAEGS
ncbi:MAG: Na(+)-translocating NADH-quinone reductase subunit C, partial [Xanthomonadales bacterium]|nr:Na(+)-translocating NADH-quinone reductase subunit C [Xanthomonadales bacterium]